MKLYQRILAGGLLAGFLDICYAIVVYGLKGIAPTRIFQSIASGLYGHAAYEGGMKMAALGGVLHFAMAIVMAAVFVLAYDRLAFLRTRTLLWGLAYGIGVFCVMYLIVMPLSAIGTMRIPHGWYFVGAIFTHTIFVGLPIAVMARRTPALAPS